MKQLRFCVLLAAIISVFSITCFARTHKTDILATDTITYTLEEEEKLSAELIIDENGIFNMKLTALSTTGSLDPNISVSVYKGKQKLYSFTTEKRGAFDDGFTPEKHNHIVCLDEGEYEVEIVNLTNLYDVTFTLETVFTEEENTESGVNKSLENATEMSLNTKYYGGLSMYGDCDWFTFEMPYDGYAFFEMYSPELKFFTIYDENRMEIGSVGLEVPLDDLVYSLRNGLAKGKYYISVTAGDNYVSPLYTVEVIPYKGEYFEKEFNNQLEFATPIEFKKEYQGNLFGINDEDIFTFTLSEACDVTISFTDTYVTNKGHYSIWLSDGEEFIFTESDGKSKTKTLSLDKGTYYFSVNSLGEKYFTNMAYKIEVTPDRNLAAYPPEEENTGAAENEPVKEEVIPFDDVPAHNWYYAELLEARRLGLIEGVGGNKYNPTDSVTVAEVIAMASRIKNTLGGENTPLENSPVGKWYNSYITFAANTGLIKTDDFDDFERYATRQEVAYIFSNLFDDVDTTGNTIIPDVDENTKYCDNIHKLYALGILKGDDENGTFYPDRSITRAEAAVILLRVHNTK